MLQVAALHVQGLDHIVLVVADVERSLRWYQKELGLQGVRIEEWRAGTAFFPSVRVNEGTIIDIIPDGGVAVSGRGNVDHFCLVVAPVDLEAVRDAGRFEVVDGPDKRYGARGDGISLYVKDPDGNTVELRHYGEA
jgi:catechol 2,3-dioxygenase-like lactoylglutathione lyase family enzyme